MNEYLKKIVLNYILPNYDKYSKDGFEFWLHDDYIRIKYNHKVYKAKIIFENSTLYWYLTPYNKSYFLTEIKNDNSFEALIFAIRDNHNYFENSEN
ncbi:MAG: hypothetical protein NC181_02550 [Clostridium sp.]|nr:hypothetical protein [Clostridium sp.]MCM1444159.1 hypothetical protein [Candidatus Amulumruptor caecigallinarius]